MINKSNLYEFHSKLTLIKEEDFLYVLPCEPLRPYISHYTISFPTKSKISDNYTVIPNASSTIVFTFDGNKSGNRLFGAASQSNKVGEDANSFLLLLIITLKPCGLSQYIKTNQSELANSILQLDTVDFPLYKKIHSAFEQALTIEELLNKLDCILFSYLDQKIISDELKIAAEMIKRSNHMISVKEISDSVHYSERHLNRIFLQHLGLNIKSFSRLTRINKAIKLLQNPQNTLTQVALQTGFYDQAHFIHDFQSICRLSPSQYLKNMSDFYNDIETL